MPKMVEGGVSGDSASPGAEIASGIETCARFVNAPKSLHGEILSDSGVSNDADSPGVNFLLVLSKQRLEGFQIARGETLQQLHLPLSIPNYCKLGCEVTPNLEETRSGDGGGSGIWNAGTSSLGRTGLHSSGISTSQ